MPRTPTSDSPPPLSSGGSATERIGREVARKVGPRRWDMWFDTATRFVVDGGTLRVEADSRFVADWIEKQIYLEVGIGTTVTWAMSLEKFRELMGMLPVCGAAALAMWMTLRGNLGSESGLHVALLFSFAVQGVCF